MNIYKEHFETIFGTRENFRTLRNKVLELAIRGELVEHDPNAEPASELAKKILSENENLKNKNDIRKEVIVNGSVYGEEIPKGWAVLKFGDIAHYKKGPFGSSITKSMFVPKSTDTYKIYEQKNAIKKDAALGDYYITKEKYETLESNYVIPNDIIVSCAGTVGETFVLPSDSEPGIINQALMRVRLTEFVVTDYYLMYFESVLEEQIKGKSKGSAIKNIPPLKVLKNIDFLLPPYEEQKRIVYKVESLMSKIGKLEHYLERKNTLEVSLPRAVLSAISNCQDEGELKIQMALIIEHFTEIFQAPASLQELRNVILQLGSQGKLVPQEPNDEPASKLLQHIQAKKAEMIKEKKIKKEKAPFKIEDAETPFKIPESWEWTKFSDIVSFDIGRTPGRKDSQYWNGGSFNWVSIADMNSNGEIFDTKEKVSKVAFDEVFKGKISKSGTLLMSFKLTVGKVSILQVDSFHNEGIISIYPIFDSGNTLRNYLFKLLPLISVHGKTKAAIKGNTLNSTSISNLLIPLPPLSEQHRILIKIESLFTVIDKLEKEMQRKQRIVEAMGTV